MKCEEDFPHSNMMCFTESWLNCNHTCGYAVIRADRDNVKSGKSVDGGLWMFIDKNWATQFTITEQTCTALRAETFTVSFRPFYLVNFDISQWYWCKFQVPIIRRPQIIYWTPTILCMRNQPSSQNSFWEILIRCHSAPPEPTVQLILQGFMTYVIAISMRPIRRPPIGKSDHNVIHLLPKYGQLCTCCCLD